MGCVAAGTSWSACHQVWAPSECLECMAGVRAPSACRLQPPPVLLPPAMQKSDSWSVLVESRRTATGGGGQKAAVSSVFLNAPLELPCVSRLSSPCRSGLQRFGQLGTPAVVFRPLHLRGRVGISCAQFSCGRPFLCGACSERLCELAVVTVRRLRAEVSGSDKRRHKAWTSRQCWWCGAPKSLRRAHEGGMVGHPWALPRVFGGDCGAYILSRV